jgi:hypothetical protein
MTAEQRAWAAATSAERQAYIHRVSDTIVQPAVRRAMRAGLSEKQVRRVAQRAAAKAPRFR